MCIELLLIIRLDFLCRHSDIDLRNPGQGSLQLCLDQCFGLPVVLGQLDFHGNFIVFADRDGFHHLAVKDRHALVVL